MSIRILRWRWHKLRDKACELVVRFLADLRETRGIRMQVHLFRLRVVKIQRAMRECLQFKVVPSPSLPAEPQTPESYSQHLGSNPAI